MRFTWAPIATLIWLLAFICRPKERVASTAIWAAVICFGLILQFITNHNDNHPKQPDKNQPGNQAVKPWLIVAILAVMAAAIIGYIIWAVWL